MKATYIYPRDKAMIDRSFSLMDKPHRVDIKPYRESRSLAQNALLHLWMNEISRKYAETYGEFHSAQTWKAYFKDRFLVGDVEMIGSFPVVVGISTADLDVGEFAEFLNNIDMRCADEFEILLSRPEDYRVAMNDN